MKLFKLLIVFLIAVSAFAADMSGKWKSVLDVNGQSYDIAYEFKVDGAKLTGTVTAANGTFDINDGKIEGDKFTFSISTDQFDVIYKGKIEADQLVIIVTVHDSDIESVAKRA